MFHKLACKLGFHSWLTQQHGFMIDSGRCDVIICWVQCVRCAESKLIHILK